MKLYPSDCRRIQQAVYEVVSKAPDGAIFIRKTLVYLLTGTAPARGEKDSQQRLREVMLLGSLKSDCFKDATKRMESSLVVCLKLSLDRRDRQNHSKVIIHFEGIG